MPTYNLVNVGRQEYLRIWKVPLIRMIRYLSIPSHFSFDTFIILYSPALRI